MTTFTQAQLADSIKANDSTYPRVLYSPGKQPVTVTKTAELTALGAGWFATPVIE